MHESRGRKDGDNRYTYSKDQPGKVANPARGRLNRENKSSLSAFAPENLVWRDGFDSPVPRQPVIRFSILGLNVVLTYGIPPELYGGVHLFILNSHMQRVCPNLSDHAIAFRWRSLPRVRRHRASKPQGSSERVLRWQVTMDQLIYASLSHTHDWFEVVNLKKVLLKHSETDVRPFVLCVVWIRSLPRKQRHHGNPPDDTFRGGRRA